MAGGYGIAPFRLRGEELPADGGARGSSTAAAPPPTCRSCERLADLGLDRRPRDRGRQPRRPRARHGAARARTSTRRGAGARSTPAAPTRCCTRSRASPTRAVAARRGEPRPVDGLRPRHLPRLRRARAGRRTRSGRSTAARARKGRSSTPPASSGPATRPRARAPPRRRPAPGSGRMKLAVEIAGHPLQEPAASPPRAPSATASSTRASLDLSRLGGIVSKGLYMEPRDGEPDPAHRGDAVGAPERDRAPGHRHPRVRARRAAAARPPRHGRARERVRRHGRGVRRGRARLRRRAGHRRPRGQHLLPERQEGRHGLRRRPAHDARGGGGGAQGDAAAGRPEALARTSADITVFARAAEEAGADALSCINTLLGLAIDVETRRPRLAFGTGGLSGPGHPAGGGAHGLAGGAGGAGSR